MRITLLDISSKKGKCANKDVNGNFGTVTHIGNSLRAKIIEKLKESGVRLPILTLAYVAAIMKKNGHDVEYKKDMIPKDSDLVIIHSSIIDYKNEIEFAKKIKKQTKAKVGFIGPFSSVKPELFLGHADFVIIGEPEKVIGKITDKWQPKGMIMSEKIDNLDALPFPDWSIFPIEKYSYKPMINEKPFLVIQSSRGCVFSCSHYCPYTVTQGTRWRDRSVKNVIAEIKQLKEKYKINGLLFRDPLFSGNKKRAEQIAQSIIDAGIDIKWACETRLDLLDKDLLKLFHDSGLRAVNVGVESADENVLKISRRLGIKKQHQEDMIKFCDEIGIKVAAFYILGMDGDTSESIKGTIEYAKKLNTHVAQFSISTPIPGTKFYEDNKNNLLTDDFEQFTSFNPVFKHKNLAPEELLKLKEHAFVSYYFRPKFIAKFIRR